MNEHTALNPLASSTPPQGLSTLATQPEDEILTAREAQQFLKIGRTKLWDLTRRQEIPAYRMGPGNRSSLRYMRNELVRWLEGNRVNGAGI